MFYGNTIYEQIKFSKARLEVSYVINNWRQNIEVQVDVQAERHAQFLVQIEKQFRLTAIRSKDLHSLVQQRQTQTELHLQRQK